MQLTFSVDGTPAVLNRDWFTGRCSLIVDGKTITIENPWNPMTQVSFWLKKSWNINVLGHRIFIEKTRPLILAGLRPQTYRVKVDGELVAEQKGF